MDLDDLRKQIVELKKSGLVRDFAAMRPGVDQGGVHRSGCDLERTSRRIVGMIDSMTMLKRTYPFLITVPGRCARIAEGAGVGRSEVTRFFVQFKAMNEFALKLPRGGWRIV
jgi:signal recognition particle GTPase